MLRPLIAIVGRPNVGKSTLFNRLVRKRVAFVQDEPGITRDRHYADTEFEDRPVTVVDTGGFVPESTEDRLALAVRQQAQAAVEECQVVLLVIDAHAGMTTGDIEVARYLRKQKRPVIVVANKIDNSKRHHEGVGELHRLGLGHPSPVSAEHNLGMLDLQERILAALPPAKPEPEAEEAADRPLRIALVGRPNVGKSSMLNALLGQPRVVVSEVAGTTRDPIDTQLTYKGKALTLTDTAGIRRKSAITQKVEQFSVLGAMRAIDDADVAVLVLDATEAGVEQDLKIASLAEEKGKALICVVNKWDLQHGKMKEADFRVGLKWEMSFLAWVPMLFCSAKTGQRVEKVLDLALELAQQQHFRAPTPMLNKVVQHVTTEHPLPWAKGRQLKIYYAAQVGEAPPSFAFMCNASGTVPDRYGRYVANYLRQTFKLRVPLRLFFRDRPGQKQRAERVQAFKKRKEHQRRGR
jgi:GTPase